MFAAQAVSYPQLNGVADFHPVIFRSSNRPPVIDISYAHIRGTLAWRYNAHHLRTRLAPRVPHNNNGYTALIVDYCMARRIVIAQWVVQHITVAVKSLRVIRPERVSSLLFLFSG